VLKRSGKGIKSSLDIYLRSSDIWLILRVRKINPEIVPHMFEYPL
jgi:hypothetical protein